MTKHKIEKLEWDIEDLEGENKKLVRLVLFFLVVMIIMFGVWIYDDIKLGKELRECQEQVPVWELNYYCDWSNIGTQYVGYYNFTNYNEYQKQTEFYKSLNCEVIE